MDITKLYKEFFDSEKSAGIILVVCTILSITIVNSPLQVAYLDFWHTKLGSHDLAHWINDGLMTIFFLLIGLELEREIYKGELSNVKNAMLPIFAAIGGMVVPAGIYLAMNHGTVYQDGAGIPMATDIAFALGILALLGSRVPVSLKIFLTALAVIDDLGAIIVIAIFYSKGISLLNLGIALVLFSGLVFLNYRKVFILWPYLIGGFAMWYFMLNSGVHATITGVLLAFAIPFGKNDEHSPSYHLQHLLHKPVAFGILPLFALANTAIIITPGWHESMSATGNLGIIIGLFLGKPVGIALFSFLAVVLGFCTLPSDFKWRHLIGTGFLGGIGFTMSVFITLLAYNDTEVINLSKMAILIASLLAGITGFIWLRVTLKKEK